ncbi:nucleoside permease [Opitutus sp. GAS368]|jgi:nucleoside transporter|uniref:nucleoside permease n=1 Tax=Opitutus sp. GAS368 TaxID=1882749 RepID=UPI00087A4613|nr:nucleoside permease [Opitutus sp. GAS368]SDR82115.1 nucleoside transporter [Opitutus sp. GAS368]
MNQTSAPARSLTFRLFGMMLLEFFIWGAWLPLIWGYMEGLGFSGTQIALIGSAFAIASVLAIFAGNQFVDRTFAAERFMAGSHLIGGLAMIGLFFTKDFTVFFGLMLIHSICYVPTISVANSLVFSHLKDAQAEFGRVRMGGTIGWILASWPLYFVLKGVSGAELQHALGYIFWVAGGASLLLAAFSLTLPHTPPKPAGGGTEALAWREALGVLLKKPFLLVLFIVTFIDSTVHNGYFLLTGGFLGHIGIKPENIMPIMSIGQVMEIVTMAGLGFCLKRLGWRWTMTIGILGHAARFLVFAFMSDQVAAVVAVQLLHGVCYAFFFATLYIFIDVAFPTDVRTSAQGLFNLLVLGLGDLAAKWLFLPLQAKLTHDGVVDYRQLMLVPAGLATVAAVILLVGFKPPAELRSSAGAAP